MLNRFRRLREIREEEDGVILVLFGVSLTVLLGMVALSFDMGRINVTQSELQSYADSVALAAAGELDGQSDSITRATAAAANLISDTQTYGSGGAALSGSSNYTLQFYETLPAADTSALTGATLVPQDANYVRVTVNSKTVGLTFAAAFGALNPGGGSPNNVVTARATAGFTQFACDITPLMFCVPQVATYNATSATGSMIQLRAGGSGQGAWGPGDFGFLDPSNSFDPNGVCGGLNGGNLDRCLLGAVGAVTQCFAQNGVDIEPGQKVGNYEAALNTRFDLYRSSMNSSRTDANYAPAPNVVKGIIPQGGGSCVGQNFNPSSDSIALPKDNCFGTNSCAHGGRFGNGTWDRANYLVQNHGGTDPVVASGAALTGALSGSRWEMYLAEIAAAGGGNMITSVDESGLPGCSPHVAPSPNRRVVVAAGIDCAANGIGGAASGVPVKEFYKIFLTQPAGNVSGNIFDIWGEVIGSAGGAGLGGTGAVIHDVVQLYR